MAKPLPFPHRYTVGVSNGHLVAPPRAPIAIGAPPQFGGTDTVWSPEELLVGAVLECLWTTFDAYAKARQLVVHDFAGGGVGVLDRGTPVPVFTSLTLAVELTVDEPDIARARELLETAKSRCIISNALNVPVTVHAEVHGRRAAKSA